MSYPLYKRIWLKPPIIFPLLAIAHFVYMLFSIYHYYVYDVIMSGVLAIPVIVTAYSIAWLYCCDMKRWAALVYIALTSINLGMRFFVLDSSILNSFTDALFPADVLFSFFLMYFFRNFK